MENMFRKIRNQQHSKTPVFKLFSSFGYSKPHSTIAKYLIFSPYLWGSLRVRYQLILILAKTVRPEQ